VKAMLNLGSRFAEYGITGGFFIFAQVSVLVWAYPRIAVELTAFLSDNLSAPLAKIPVAAQSPFTSLLVAVSVVSVFFVWLLLDLIGSLFVYEELFIFRTHLERNQQWISKFI
jgi:hypothetical protein